MRYLLIITLFMIVSCEQQLPSDQNSNPTVKLNSISNVINSGSLNHQAKINEQIIINQSKSSNLLEVSLGKRDFKHAIFDYFDNGVQKSITFNKAGKYQLTVRSGQSSNQLNVMMNKLDILIIE